MHADINVSVSGDTICVFVALVHFLFSAPGSLCHFVKVLAVEPRSRDLPGCILCTLTSMRSRIGRNIFQSIIAFKRIQRIGLFAQTERMILKVKKVFLH